MWKITNLEICPGLEVGFATIQGEISQPLYIIPVHTHRCAHMRARIYTAPHFIFILATNSNELVLHKALLICVNDRFL